MEQVDSVAHRYGILPSELLGIREKAQALTVDLWAHNWGAQREKREAWEAGRGR